MKDLVLEPVQPHVRLESTDVEKVPASLPIGFATDPQIAREGMTKIVVTTILHEILGTQNVSHHEVILSGHNGI